MRKKFFNRSFVCIISFLIMLLCTTATEIPGIKAAVDGGTDIWLKIQTKEIDIDDIPDDRIVDLDISIQNNPGIDIIGFLIEKDSRLEFSEYDVFENVHKGIGGSSHRRFDNNENILYNEVIFGIYANEDNGTFVKVKLKIPDNAQPGDFYSLKLLTSYEEVNPCIGLVSPESKIIYGSEYFGGFEDAGIRITDNTPMQPVQNDPESQLQRDQPSAQPVQDQNNGSSGQVNNNNNNVQQPTAGITPTMAAASQTVSELTSSVTGVNVTKATTVLTSVSTEYADTELTDKIQTDMREEQTYVSDKSNGKTKKIICVSIAVIILIAIIYLLNRYRKKDNT